jgi:hypothetical protein
MKMIENKGVFLQKSMIFIFLLTLSTIQAQTLDYLPDSAKQLLEAFPDNLKDSIYYDIGDDYYQRFNDEGYTRALDCYRMGLALSEKHHKVDNIRTGYYLIGAVYDAFGEDPDWRVKLKKRFPLKRIRFTKNKIVLKLSYGNS